MSGSLVSYLQFHSSEELDVEIQDIKISCTKGSYPFEGYLLCHFQDNLKFLTDYGSVIKSKEWCLLSNVPFLTGIDVHVSWD